MHSFSWLEVSWDKLFYRWPQSAPRMSSHLNPLLKNVISLKTSNTTLACSQGHWVTISEHLMTIVSVHQELLSLPMGFRRWEEELGVCRLLSPSLCALIQCYSLSTPGYKKEGAYVKNRVLLCKVILSSGTHSRTSDWEFSKSYNPKSTSPFILAFSSF